MGAKYITVAVRLPADDAGRRAVTQALALGAEVTGGGRVTAAYAGDAVSENEIYEQHADPLLVKSVRDEVARLGDAEAVPG